MLGRLVSGDETDAPQITTAEEWQVGFAPGPGDNANDRPRHKPDYCLNIGITWPGLVALEVRDRVPTLSFKSFGAIHRRGRRTSRVDRRYRGECTTELGWRFRERIRSCPGNAVRHKSGSHDEL